MRQFKEIFKEKGISPSYTRIRIYAFLEESKDHPTVDSIYQSLKEELPTLSKTTVYNVLKLFLENNLVKSVNINNTESRYELNHTPHSHFQCDVCGTIYDIPHIVPNYNKDNLADFFIKEEEVNLRGVCPNCK
jgi:Fe2+ or Zn2+ uptake regulation protein